jgi:hypothetical protein
VKTNVLRFGRACAFACALPLLIAACAERRAAPQPPLREVCAPVPSCPSWVEAFKQNRVPLHVYLFDGVTGTIACAKGQKLHATVVLDGESVGTGDVPCLDQRVTPEPFYRIEGPAVVPGMHELRVEVQTPRGVVQGTTLLSLPAFDIPTDGKNAVFGAEIAVGVGPDDLAIGAPQVYAPRGQ